MVKDDITPSDIKRLMLQNYRRFKNGEISDSKATKENAILADILKAIEASETEGRLQAIEKVLSLPEYDSYEDEDE